MKTTPEFQVLMGLFFGLLLGLFSHSLFGTILFTIFFEYIIFVSAVLYPPGEKLEDRILINVVYIFGWCFSRFLFLRETGCESCIHGVEVCYNTFPN